MTGMRELSTNELDLVAGGDGRELLAEVGFGLLVVGVVAVGIAAAPEIAGAAALAAVGNAAIIMGGGAIGLASVGS